MEPEDRPLFLPGILYALGRIGEAAPGTISESVDSLETALSEPDSQARAMSVWCLGRTGRRDILLRHPELGKDTGRALLYHEEKILDTTVGGLYTKTMGRKEHKNVTC